jgi:hypothetical protein
MILSFMLFVCLPLNAKQQVTSIVLFFTDNSIDSHKDSSDVIVVAAVFFFGHSTIPMSVMCLSGQPPDVECFEQRTRWLNLVTVVAHQLLVRECLQFLRCDVRFKRSDYRYRS